jgi:serine/threonine-protein kinase
MRQAADPTEVAPEPTVGGPVRIGRYEVLCHLASGGMAQIYLARQSGLGSFERHVVLKTIVRERAADQRFVTMFLDEAKLAATLNHQNIAQVYEVDQADGAYYMAMEYVHGENSRALLETTIRRGWTIPLELAVMIISGAAAGLHHAHERRGKNGQPLNIVHRDVSPANIMVGYDGAIKVLDFGIAKAEERATKTMGGTIKGKYGYMSPEQCKGKPIDRRSDIFALGIVLYELTTLRRAFKGNDDFETMRRIVAGDLVLPTTVVPGFPRELEAIILTALANDPAARFQSGQEMIEALDAFTVRAKLTGTNTAMGRFMVQLFGTKKEPWIETPASAAGNAEHTVVTPIELLPSEGDDDGENDETLIVSNRQDVQRVLESIQPIARPPASALDRDLDPAAVGAAASPHVPMHPLGDPEPSGRLAESTRPSGRRIGDRPSLPFSGERTPVPAAMSTGGYGVPVAPPAAQTHQHYALPPAVTAAHTLTPGGPPPMPPASYAPPAHTQPPYGAPSPVSHPGASTMIGPAPIGMPSIPGDPGAASAHSHPGIALPPMASGDGSMVGDASQIKLRASSVWIVIGVVVAVVTAGVILLMT